MDEEQDILLETGNTPSPTEVGKTNVSGTAILDAINPIKPTNSNVLNFISSTANNYRRISSRAPEDNMDSQGRGELLRGAGEEEYLGGLEYNYDYSDARPLITDDLAELQAQRQSWGSKVLSGFGRAVGEFVINVVEIPGVVGGAIAAGVDQDINKITDNFWVNYTDSLKENLQDALPVYQRKAITEGGVFAKMTSADWWATEGASGAAFMASALIPGIGLAKLPKALSLTRYLAKSGKYAKRVLSQVDDVAVKLGLAEKSAVTAGRGVGAKSAIDLINATMANTLFESGVEARGAQEAYNEQAFAKLSSGEINQDQYQALLAKGSEAAANVFGLNMGLLLVPNLIMSKMILGPRANTLFGIGEKSAVKLGAAGRFEETGRKAFTGFGAKALNSNITREIAGSLKRGATNTIREGLIEEAGQGAIEQYWTTGFLTEQTLGERSKGIAKTYTDFLKTTDGQVAVLFGGLLSAVPSAWNYKKGKDIRANQAKTMVNLFNNASNIYEASKTDFLKRDKDGELILDENDNPIRDDAKIAELSVAKAIVEDFQNAQKAAMLAGDMTTAKAYAARLQAQVWAPFISAGEQGLDSLKEMMTANPATAIAVEEYNRQTGSNISIEEYVQVEMEKAKAHLKDLKYFSRNLQSSVPFSFIRDKKLKGEELENAEIYREKFQNNRAGLYLEANAVNRIYEEDLQQLNDDIAKAEKNKDTDILSKLKEDKQKIEDSISEVQKEIKRLTSFDAFEKDWADFYKVQKKTDDINDGKISGYLDDLLSQIKNAKSEEEVVDLVKKAEEAGLILSEVKIEKVPEELIKMVDSDSIIESLGALHILGKHKGEAYSKEFEEAKKNINRLRKSALSVFERIERAALDLQERAAVDRAKHEQLTEEIRNVNIILEEATLALDFHQQQKKTGTSSKLYSEMYLKLVKARKDAMKTSLSLFKDIRKLEKEMKATEKRLVSYITVLKAISNVSTNTKLKSALSNVTKNATDYDKDLVESLFEGGQMPLSLQDVLDALYSEKDIILDMVDELEEVVIESSTYNYLTKELSRLNRYKNSLDKIVKQVDKTIKKYESYKQSKENDLILIELREQANDLQNTILEVDREIIAIEDHFNRNLFTDVLNLNTFTAGIEEIIQAIEDLNNGEYSEPTIPKFNKTEGQEKANEIIKEIEDFISNRSEMNDEAMLEFQNKLLSDLQIKVDKLGLTDSKLTDYIDYVFNNLYDTDVMTFKEFAPEQTEFTQETTNEFIQTEDPTNGKGFTRIPESMHETFAVMFSAETVINKFVETAVNNLFDELGNPDYNNLSKLSLIMRMHPTFKKMLSKDLKEQISEVDQETDVLWEQFFKGGVVSSKSTEKESIKEEDIEDKELSDTIKTINNTEIRKEVQKAINEKNKALLSEKLDAIKELAQTKKKYWRTAVGAKVAITEGNTVYWDKDTKSNKGEVFTILKSTRSGGNALILDDKGKLHVVSTMKLTKVNRNIGVTNKENYDAWLKSRDNSGEFNLVALPIHKKGEPVTVFDKQKNVIVSRNAFLDYLEDTEDKMNDLISFSFSPSKLEGLIKSKLLLEDQKSKETVEKYRQTLSAYNKAINNEELSNDEIELLANYIPITVRVERANRPGGAGTFIPILTEANAQESFKSMEGALRKSIISYWLQNDRKLEKAKHPGTIVGLSAKWSYIAPGELNVDPKAYGENTTKITDLKGVSYDNMDIYVIQNPDSNHAINKRGEIETLSFDQRDKKGLPFLKVKTNTGAPFYLALNQKTLADSKELDIVMDILDTFMKSGGIEDLTSTISKELENKLAKEIPLLYEAFGEKITNGDVLKTIFYSGKEDTQLKTVIDPRRHTIKIGDQLWNVQAYNESRNTIKSILGQKYFRTGFTNETTYNALTVQNKKYLEYLVESKIVSSNIKANEPIFAAVPGEGNYLKGVAAYLKSDDLIFDKQPISKEPIKITDKNIKLLGEVRVILQSNKINPRKLSKVAIASLNASYTASKTKWLKISKTEIENIVNQANKETGKTEEKTCND